jgi:hypothetical protein
MTASSAVGTTAPESLLVRYVKAHIRKGEQAKDKAEQHFIAAGRYLVTLKANYAPSWQHWEDLLRIKVGLSAGRASELMQLADGRKTVEQIRSEKAQSMRKLRASSSPRGEEGEDAEGPASVATAPLTARSALGPPPSRVDTDRLIDALACSTPAVRTGAVSLLDGGDRQTQFQSVRDAVADLYQQLSRAGR